MKKRQLLGLLAKGKTEACLENLLVFALNQDDDNKYDKLILLSGKFHTFKQEKEQGILSFEEKDLTLNRINKSLLSFIRDIDFSISEKVTSKQNLQSNTQKIQLTIDSPIETFHATRKRDLINVVSGLLGIDRKKVKVTKVLFGSIIVELMLPREKAILLKKSFSLGALPFMILKDEFKIQKIVLVSPFYILVNKIKSYFFTLSSFAIIAIGIALIASIGVVVSLNYNISNQPSLQLSLNNDGKTMMIYDNDLLLDSSSVKVFTERLNDYNTTDILNIRLIVNDDLPNQIANKSIESSNSYRDSVSSVFINKGVENFLFVRKNKLDEKLTDLIFFHPSSQIVYGMIIKEFGLPDYLYNDYIKGYNSLVEQETDSNIYQVISFMPNRDVPNYFRLETGKGKSYFLNY